MNQAELFDPTPADVPRLVSMHLDQASKAAKSADRFDAFGMAGLARQARQVEAQHYEEAACLSMLADLYALAGVVA